MKLAASLFFLVLVHAHYVGDLAQPLSLLRDGPQGWLGYALFALLLLIGLLYTATLVRAGREGESLASGFATVLLAVVAVTPSWGGFHLFCSILLLLLLYSYTARVLRRAASLWLFPHLLVPAVLAGLTRFHSYGAWQKSLIAYFVLVVVFHDHVLAQQLKRNAAPPALLRSPRRGRPLERRRVYLLEAGREWVRQKPVCSKG
jgi:hypothetical protein